MHLYNLFEPYTNSGPDIISVSKTVGGENMVLKFKTVSLPLFAVYHRMFYKYNSAGKLVKIVPDNIIELMSPVTLAHLIMGDGNIKLHDGIIRIYTNSFSKEKVELLASSITVKLNILTRVVHDRNNQYIITISKSQLSEIRNIILPYMHPTMYYKLGLELSNSYAFDYEHIIRII